MITTLRTGALTLSSIQYKFDTLKRLTIRLTTSANHKIYGDVNILLANVLEIDIYTKEGALIQNYFNRTFEFTRISSTILEFSEVIGSGIAPSESFATLENDGDPIAATVANSYFDLPAGNYNFLLLDSADSDFSDSQIGIKMLDIGKTGVNGIESIFDETGEGDYLSINNQDLSFNYPARISIKNDDSGNTNIPLIINN